MSDFNSSLPVKTQSAGDIVAKIGDGTLPSQQLGVDSSGKITVKINDGTGNAITSTSSALDVNIKSGGSSGVVTDKTAFTYGTTTDLIIGAVFQDTSPTVTAGQGGALRMTASRAVHMNMRDSSGNELLGSKTSANSMSVVVASDQAALAVKLQDGSGSAVSKGQTTLSGSLPVAIASDQSAIPTKLQDGAGSAVNKGQTTMSASLPVTLASDQSSLGVKISDNTGTAYSVTNPLPVYMQETLGTAVNDYVTSSAVAAAATSNHDYTVTTGKTLTLTEIKASASGKLKIEVQIETGAATGVFNSKFVGFSSTANPNIRIPLSAPIQVGAGVRVRVIRTNNDASAQDLYSTVSGREN